MDKRFQVFAERLNALSLDEIQRIKDNIDVICFDTFNYHEETNTYCPLAVALDLHNTIYDPTNDRVGEEISKRFQPVNALKGIDGEFYTTNRREDLLKVCDLIFEQKMNVYITDELKTKWVNYEFLGKPFKLSDGKLYMRAHSKCFNVTHFYCLDDDWFWHDRNSIPLPVDKTDSPDIINKSEWLASDEND